MSDQEVPKLSLLDQFIQQRDSFIQQRDQVHIQLQQLQGAIFACEQMIEKIKADQGEKTHDEANSEQAEKVA